MEKGKTKEKLVLLDAHAIIHRAYHALPEFATSSGVPTGALYGFVSMILKIASDLKPDYIVAAYDLPKPTYRHEVYDGYKSGRAKTDEALVAQIEKSKEICECLGIPVYSKEGFEADDVLGTIVENTKAQKNLDVVIASGDMDTLQLISGKKVQVYTLKKGITDTIIYDEEKVKERYGFGPELLTSYKGLRGDPSDNIIGIEGIGDKTATDLIKNFGSIDDIYKKLKSKKTEIEKIIRPRILELLKEKQEEARFSQMLATIRRDVPIDFHLPKQTWKSVIDIKRAKQLFSELQFRTLGSRLDGVLGDGKSEDIENEEKKVNLDSIDEGRQTELKVALWVVDSNITNPTLEDIYNFANTEKFEKAWEAIFHELKKRESQFIYEEIEKPLIPIVRRMGEYGVLIDKKFLEKLDREYSLELAKIEKNIWKETGEEFNISSPKQLGEVLFDKLGLTVKNQKKTAGGAKSTRESELLKLRSLHPSIPLILEHRELSKLLSTYINPIPKMLDGNNRLHARFIQTGAATGRMASENPNLQNIPIGSEKGKVIRHAFITPKGSQLVALDYSQIELRIAAFLSFDKKLIQIFKEGKDVHGAVASQVFGVPESGVDKEMRRKAKVINFGILYGMGVTALQENLGTDRKTAQEFLNAYFDKFVGLSKYIENTKKEAASLGYTKTFFGRRRYFEGIRSSLPFIRASAERMAINAPIQGTQADIIKIAMKEIDVYLNKNGLQSKVHLLLQIHDELIYEIENEMVLKTTSEIKRIMESVLTLDQTLGVPIIVNTATGNNWGEMK
ncbi:MAG: DNA polymerase [Patescibacteria group bacterium]